MWRSLASASGLGPESRRFKSCHPDLSTRSHNHHSSFWRNYGFTSANEIRQESEKSEVQQVRLTARFAARAMQTLQPACRSAEEIISLDLDQRLHLALQKTGEQKFAGKIVPQQRAVGAGAQRTVNQPLLLADHHPIAHGALRRWMASDWATVSCRQVNSLLNRLLFRSRNSGAKRLRPAAVCTNSNLPSCCRKWPGPPAVRHSGKAGGNTVASRFFPSSATLVVLLTGLKFRFLRQGQASPVLQFSRARAEHRVGQENELIFPSEDQVALQPQAPAEFYLQLQVIHVLIGYPASLFVIGDRHGRFAVQGNVHFPSAGEDRVIASAEFDIQRPVGKGDRQLCRCNTRRGCMAQIRASREFHRRGVHQGCYASCAWLRQGVRKNGCGCAIPPGT